jgi:hypothetical protein
MTRLIAFGCSYTRGTGLDDVWDFEKNCSIFPQPSKYAWPQLVADELNVECINLGKGGYSNKAIWHTVINFEFKPSDIVFIHWSYLDRYHYYETNDNGIIVDHKGSTARDKAFFKYLHSDYDMLNDLYLRMNHINTLHNNIQHILIDPIDNVPWNNVTPIDVYLNEYKIKYPRANDNSHPGMLAHQEFSKQLLQILKY